MGLKPVKNYTVPKAIMDFLRIYMGSGGGSSGGSGGSSGCKTGYNTGSGSCNCGSGYTFGGN